MRVIARRGNPHPGAQLRLTDDNGWRITCFATNTIGWSVPDLEVRHRQRARAEDRIRNLKDTGLRNLPFHGFNHNQIWLDQENRRTATPENNHGSNASTHPQPATHPITRPGERSRLAGVRVATDSDHQAATSSPIPPR
jgi:hypothetical protein